METKKQKYWVPSNVIATRGNVSQEYYIIKNDGFAYPCNKQVDDVWWKKLSPDDYDADLQSIRPENVRKYWDVISVYSPLDATLDMSMWTSGNIGETAGGLFYHFNEERAFGVNQDGSFLEKETYDSFLKCNIRNRKNWDFVRIYERIV